ncbi:DUF2149 domain-containing protein [Altericroceibacterium spongiae]|uniref:DUF2149 domain-containing protein n=1 Tax=Altericroceibacterium spongiae TaxID=2320269 RepID=A0A420ERL6_9SPHN|nr:DUF2149 domain-containing protein [Altericroceibacterium spongiae]RKF23325.1 DUF2149 domain-containing protein [Altericroceibacterium spongiae]
MAPRRAKGRASFGRCRNSGEENMTITIRNGEKLKRYTSGDRIGEGGGIKAGTTYRLPEGNLVYIPESE